MRYRSKFKLSKDIVMRDQATKFVKIVREINGQEKKCEVAIAKGYCPKKSCIECNEKDDIDEEVAKTILIYIPKGVSLDESTERKLNLLAMSEDMRNYNCFTNVNTCKEKCLDETTNNSLTSIQSTILPSKTKSQNSILPSSKKSDSIKI
ncbi:Hypothetical protein SRAE_1000265600 [Strongyloides ratti]|uniref:Uncharacterized protein n=1 Tax=Strongyloides ratti TaxID=34506 RepID=A0A090L3V2_STRRB|nr:Hypothetical protein SRAE_1000265600 [Strongyloides ratti]CEF64402.1 Hypothetical protein SRAE_1000265600 [Strongyloides ratti]